MKAIVELPEDVARNKAVPGTIFITDDGIANFRKWNRKSAKKQNEKYKRLPHGRVSRNEERTYIHLSIKHDEGIKESDAIFDESWTAKVFLEQLTIDNWQLTIDSCRRPERKINKNM